MERLGPGHEFLVVSSGEALELLSSKEIANCRFLDVPCLRFEYTDGRMDVPKSILSGLRYAAFNLSGLVVAI